MGGLIYSGSVKGIGQERPPTDSAFGDGYMEFGGDDFSIFDYGKMPWQIKGKGENLYRTSLKFFEVLADAGIETHFVKDLGDRKIGIRLANMPQDYDEIKPGVSVVYRIPIECIYSKIVTPVASLHKRLRSGKTKPEEVGLDKVPERGETVILPETRTTFSTKIEAQDVYKGLATLAQMGGLVGDEPDMLREQTLKGGEALMRYGNSVGVHVADGKLEFMLGPEREIIICDTGLSYDENRLLVQLDDGIWIDLSKQFPRNIYNILGQDWKKALSEAQKSLPDKQDEWPEPPEIGTRYKDLCSDACSVVSAALVGEDVRSDLIDIATQVHEGLEDLKREHKRDETGADL